LTTADLSGTVTRFVHNADNTEVVMRVRFAALSALLVLAVPPAASAWTWPVDGPVLRPFSFGSDPYAAGQHRGIDIGAPSGTPVRAAAGGVVSFAGTVPKGGKTVTIQTSTGYAVTLVHLGSIRVIRGTTVEEGATVGTVGPSGVPDIPEPYVYLGIRVASDDQGYVDPLLFLPPRAQPPASPESASDPPSAPAGETSGGEASAPRVPAEPPPASAPAADAGAGETRPATQEPAGEPAPDAAVEPHPATVPVAEAPAAPAAAAPPVAEAPAADSAPAAPAQGPEGGRAVTALPAEVPTALGGRSSAGSSSSVEPAPAAWPFELTAAVEPAEHHATPAGARQPRRPQIAARVEPSPEGAVVQTSTPDVSLLRRRRPDGIDATARRGSRATATEGMSPRDGLWIAAALVATLVAGLGIRRHRQRPGATPAGPEAPRMMVLVGGSRHEVDARRFDRRPGAAAAWPAPTEHDDRLAA
jgi:Peptidase family M23